MKKYHCRKCQGIRNHEIVNELKTKGNEEHYFQWIETFSLIKCLGCDSISFLKIYSDTEMVNYDHEGVPNYYEEIDIYPKFLDKNRELNHLYHLPPKIKNIYLETVNALKNQLYILAAGGLRTTIEAICNHLKIRKGDLSTRIDLLTDKGYLTNNESKRLHSIRFLGNDALHEVDIPNEEHVNILFDIVNHLLENLFIQDSKIAKNIRIIDEYDDFKKAIINNIKKDMLNNIYSFSELLGTSKRLVKSKLLPNFKMEFDQEIENSKIDYIMYIEEAPEKKYKILKMPEFIFNNDLDFDFEF